MNKQSAPFFDSSDEYDRRETWSKITKIAKNIQDIAKCAQRKNTSTSEAEAVIRLACLVISLCNDHLISHGNAGINISSQLQLQVSTAPVQESVRGNSSTKNSLKRKRENTPNPEAPPKVRPNMCIELPPLSVALLSKKDFAQSFPDNNSNTNNAEHSKISASHPSEPDGQQFQPFSLRQHHKFSKFFSPSHSLSSLSKDIISHSKSNNSSQISMVHPQSCLPPLQSIAKMPSSPPTAEIQSPPKVQTLDSSGLDSSPPTTVSGGEAMRENGISISSLIF